MMSQLVLASNSPRRKELLSGLGVEFSVLGADIDESVLEGETPKDYVERLAVEKAKAVLGQSSEADCWVLGSDTTVVANGEILGKPIDEQDFIRMMKLLSGQDHSVLTSIALVSHDQVLLDCIETKVRFTDLTDDQILAYWQTGEPHDKAGGYGIQGLGSVFVDAISGSYSAVVGLPLHETARVLSRAGICVWSGQLNLAVNR